MLFFVNIISTYQLGQRLSVRALNSLKTALISSVIQHNSVNHLASNDAWTLSSSLSLTRVKWLTTLLTAPYLKPFAYATAWKARSFLINSIKRKLTGCVRIRICCRCYGEKIKIIPTFSPRYFSYFRRNHESFLKAYRRLSAFFCFFHHFVAPVGKILCVRFSQR